MATVVKVTEVLATTATLNESARKEYEVLFDALDGNAIEACTATDGVTTIPAIGSTFSGTLITYIAQRPIATRVRKSTLFKVIVPYEIQSTQFGGNQSNPPLSRTTEWSTDGLLSSIAVDRDSAGNLLLNSSGQVLKANVQHADKYIRAVKVYSSLQNFDSYFNKTNSVNYTIQGQTYTEETLWLSHVTQDFTEEVFDGEVEQNWVAIFHFYAKIKRGSDEPNKSWRFKILDRGTVTTAAGIPSGIAIGDDFATIVGETNLNGQGGIWDGTNAWFLDGASSFAPPAPTNDYKTMYQTADFNALGL